LQKKLKWYCKHILYFLLFYSRLLHLLISFLKATKHNHSAVVLFYHRFCKPSKENKLLPSLDIKEFRKQILHLKRFYKFISMDDLEGIVSKGQYFKAPSIVVTIDDGYLDNYIFAYPILRQYGIPAMIYLTVGLIGTENGVWVDDLELALTHAKVQSFCLKEVFGTAVVDISTHRGKKNVGKILFSRILRLGNKEREHLVQKLFDILNVDRSVIENRPRVMLNWDEVSEMATSEISFGAHTLSHPYLPALPSAVAKHEIKNSKEMIEKHLGRAVKHFAIPNGKPDDFTSELREFCESIGFDTIVTTESGRVDSTSNRYSLQRALPPPPLYYFACEIAKYFFLSRRG